MEINFYILSLLLRIKLLLFIGGSGHGNSFLTDSE